MGEMMTILSIFILTLSLAYSANTQQKKSDREHDQLSGSVKTVRIEKAKLSNKDGKPVEERRILDRSWTYDKNGNLVREIIGRYHYLYSQDSKGNRLEKRNPNIIMGGSPEPTDFNNQVKAEDGSLFYKWIPKYDAQGNRIEELIYLGDRELLRKYTYTYDSNGRRIEGKLYNSKGSLTHKWVYNYEANGRIKELVEYEYGGSVASKRSYNYEFDSVGNWIKATISKLVTKKGQPCLEP